jgi:hypothetical protein
MNTESHSERLGRMARCLPIATGEPKTLQAPSPVSTPWYRRQRANVGRGAPTDHTCGSNLGGVRQALDLGAGECTAAFRI